MANLRIVYNNAADRATLTASSTAGSLAVSNLLTDYKSEVWRATNDISETITLTWTNAEIVRMVALPFASLTSSATIRVQGYTEAADASPAFDTGVVAACPSAFGSVYWGGQALGVNAYSYGGGTYACVWFAGGSVKKLVVTLADPTNPLGYIEASRIVCGAYFTPANNCDYGAEIGVSDTSKNQRSDAGDLRTDRGVVYKTLRFNLSQLTTTDKNEVWRIMRGTATYKPVFVSLTPEDTDVMGEQVFQIYGKLSRLSGLKFQFMNQFESSIEVEEI